MDEPSQPLMAWVLWIPPAPLCSIYARVLLDLSQPTTQFPLKYGPTTTYFLSSEVKLRKNLPPPGRLQRGPPGPGGVGGHGFAATGFGFAETLHCSGPVYWHLTADTYSTG